MTLDFLTASRHVEQAATAVAAGILVLLLSRALRRGAMPGDVLLTDVLERALDPTREAACLVAIVVVALAMRTVGWKDPLTAPHWFSEMPALFVADAVERGSPWREWFMLLRNFQGFQPQHSGPFMVLAAVFQRIFGPVLHLPVLIGAFLGVVGVVFAWLAGRMLVGRLYGLLFATLLAVSPLNLVWSRIGGLPITAVPAVLLVVWLAYRAGSRRSFVSTVASGVAAWATIYLYYPARIAIPLAFVSLWRGLRDASTPRRHAIMQSACLLGMLAGLYWWASSTGAGRVIWPTYAGYTGNRGERTLAEIVAGSIKPVQREGARALAAYFFRGRRDPSDAAGWGAALGGLAFAPVAVIGAIGLLAAARHPVRWLPWLVLAAGGFAAPVLSLPSARRFLVFDVGWCALGALGVVSILRSRLTAGLSPRCVAAAIAIGLVGLATWTSGTVFSLNRALSPRAGTAIPFGESAGLGDGRVCRRCVAAGHQWQRQIAQGAFVILVDSDAARENRTIPGGLPLYGKLAALAAGRPRNFADFYTVWSNTDIEPPRPAVPLRPRNVDFATYLVGEIERAEPDSIVWHFEQPTAWERWLARRLVAGGGTESRFVTPLGAGLGLQVSTARGERTAVFALLRELAASDGRDDAARVHLQERQVLRFEVAPFVLGGIVGPVPTAPPEWIAGLWHTARFGGAAIPIARPVGASVHRDPDGRAIAELLDGGGAWVTWRVGVAPPTYHPKRVVQSPVPMGCAAFAGGAWWVVDAARGALVAGSDSSWVPPGEWIGVGAGPGDQLLLASADQNLVVLDVAERRELRRFSMPTWPSRRRDANECAPLAAGDTWYATFNHLTSVVTFYALDGRLIGSRDLERLLGLGNHRIMSIAGVGRWLAVGLWQDDASRVLEVSFPAADAP